MTFARLSFAAFGTLAGLGSAVVLSLGVVVLFLFFGLDEAVGVEEVDAVGVDEVRAEVEGVPADSCEGSDIASDVMSHVVKTAAMCSYRLVLPSLKYIMASNGSFTCMVRSPSLSNARSI